jgi:Mn2+/Fe2+ NRAMP family transporter
VADRIGSVTHKGLGELIRENYSKQITGLVAIPMALVDIINYIVEYTGIAIGFEIFGISPRISIPLVFIVELILVYKRKYADVEKLLMVISILFCLAWVASAFLTPRRGIKITPFYFSTAHTQQNS